MNDQPATPPVGRIFEPTLTVDMCLAGGASKTPLPSCVASQLQLPVREGDVGTFHGWPIVRLLGRGGMALVLHGYDQKLRRDVAIKMIHPDRLEDRQMAARFAREARLTAQVIHPNVITVYSVHDESDQAYIVMEYLHGGTLQEHIAEHPVSEEECIRTAREIARGLQAAHEIGLLHRDLKPSNIGFRQPGGHVVIMDFGLARTLVDTDPLTVHGSPMGTPAFMSPEQIQVQKLDHRTDLFSLGTVMFLMVTGQHPFQGSTPAVLCHAIASSPTPPLRRLVPGISPGLEAIITRLLQKSPSQRFQTAAQLIEALDRLSQPPPQRQRLGLIAGIVATGVITTCGAYYASRLVNGGNTSPVHLAALPGGDTAEASSPASTTHPPAPPALPEFRDANGVVWRSTNREHAGSVSVDDDGGIRLGKSADATDHWAMVEGTLAGLPTAPRYLLLDIEELTKRYDVRWAIKLAPTDGSNLDIELYYGQEAGRFAFLLPEVTETDGSTVPVRIFLIGSDGAFVHFSHVHLASAVPKGYQQPSVLPSSRP